MAGRGPLPKQHHQRERDTRRRQADAVTVTRDGVLRGPTIEEATLRDDWSPEVRAWWDTWRRAPQAALFEDTDWRRLAIMAPILASYYRKPTAAALVEIRLNEERLGATYADRLRSRIRIEDDTATLAPVVEHPAASREAVAARLRREES